MTVALVLMEGAMDPVSKKGAAVPDTTAARSHHLFVGSLMEILVGALVLSCGVFGIRFMVPPPCPRCRSRKWDRKVCRPLLLCRRCATRIDAHGRAFN
jgi:hypothetical protein